MTTFILISIQSLLSSVLADEICLDWRSFTVPDEGEEERLDDYYNYDYEAREEPMSRQDWFDLRTRRKRQAPEEPKKENTLIYTVCARYAMVSWPTTHFFSGIRNQYVFNKKIYI